MKEYINQFFEICTPEIELAVDLISGICEERRVSSTALSAHIKGDASLASKQRRIERFYSKGYVDAQYLLEAIRNMFGKQKFILSLDRTNWKFGTSSINAFAAFASRGEVGSLLNLKMLDNKGGNSKSRDRIELAMAVINNYGRESIENILGDREFFSLEFVAWLTEKELPYTLRVRENLEFLQPYLRLMKSKVAVFKNIAIGVYDGIEIRGDLSIKKLKNEYLILVSRKVRNPFVQYLKRWAIERFFKMLKTGGLNIESTKITDSKRLAILFLLCSIAYLVCVKIGVYRHHKIKKMRWKKKSKCYEYSYFRWGLDWLKDLITRQITTIKSLTTQIFPSLHA